MKCYLFHDSILFGATRLKYQLETDEERPIDFDENGLKEYLSHIVTEVKKD